MQAYELHVDPDIYNKYFPKFGLPTVIGYIDLENLKYAKSVCNKEVVFDLNRGLNEAIVKPQGLDVKLDRLLNFLNNHETSINFDVVKSLDEAKFFCYRGLMKLVAVTPYEKKEPWKIVATLLNGAIYLCMRQTEEKLMRIKNMTPEERKFTSWGYKFEQFILSDKPNLEPNPDLPVNENDEFALIFKTYLNRHFVVYGAEMDGVRCDKTPVSPLPSEDLENDSVLKYLSDQQFIELKTNRHLEFKKQKFFFWEHKALQWWCQSYLAGVCTILCGFRNDEGIVEELKTFEVAELPRKAKRWKPNVCINFLDAFFTYVKRSLASKIRREHGDKYVNELQKLPLISVMFEWTPGGPVRVNENYVFDDDPILPQWFIDSYGKRRKYAE